MDLVLQILIVNTDVHDAEEENISFFQHAAIEQNFMFQQEFQVVQNQYMGNLVSTTFYQ